LGQKQTSDWRPLMSALPPKADIAGCDRDVRFVPKADIGLPSLDNLVWRVLTQLAARRNQGFDGF
jgi:hypothetical protein